MNPTSSRLCILVSTAALVGACTSEKTPPKTAIAPPPAPPAQTAPKTQPAPESETAGSLRIDNKIIAACGDLPAANFAFDSANLDPDAKKAFEALARCFVSGPLKGRSMKLIGHADPRGETMYNFGLGQRRAANVAGILNTFSMERARMATSSRGELESTGVDEDSWSRDRRVDIELAE